MSSPSSEGLSRTEELLAEYGIQADKEKNVSFRDNDAQHPRNWAAGKKAYNVVLVCAWEFWMTAVSSSGTSASDTARKESYGFGRILGYFMFTSLYLLGQAAGSVVFSPLSETFGRRQLYVGAAVVFCVFNAIIGAVDSEIAVCFGRFITGAVSAIPATVAFGTFDDMFDSQSRIWIVYLYTMSGINGLVVGPIYSAYVSYYAGWRWVFYIATIVAGIGSVGAVFMSESRIGYLLDKKVAKIHKETGDDSLKVPGKKEITFAAFFKDGLFLPLMFLVSEPIVLMCAVLMSISYSLIYGLTTGLTVVYSEFGFNASTSASLAFIPFLVGIFLDALPRFWDDRKLKKLRKEQRTILPESKVDSLWTSCPALAIGFWIFAWTIPPFVHGVPWIVSMIGLAFVGYSTNDLAYVLFGYLTDAYGDQAASACSAISLSRTVVAAAYPLFTYQMYSGAGLGGNLATTIWAAIATAFCITPFLFSRYGTTLRKKSKRAIKDDGDDDNNNDDEEKGGAHKKEDEGEAHQDNHDHDFTVHE